MKNSDLTPSSRDSPAEIAGRNKDLDLSTYFLVRRASNRSDALSSKFGGSPKTVPSKFPSYAKSPKALSQKSGGSSRELRTRANSYGSEQSTTSRGQAIRDWNDNNNIESAARSSAEVESSQWVDPPRPPKEGFEWVWFPEGYWAERELPLSKKPVSRPRWWNRSPERGSKVSMKSESPEKCTPPIDIPKIKIGSLISRKPSAAKSSSGKSFPAKPLSAATPDFEASASTSRKSSLKTQDMRNQHVVRPNMTVPMPAYHAIYPDERLGLYCRTKNTIRSRFLHKSSSADDASVMDVDRLTSRTTQLLQGTSQYLDRVKRERCQTSATWAPDAPRTPESQTSRSTRKFGLAPWHRRSSHESILSVSSSVFRLLLGKAPAATPIQEFPPEGLDSKTYNKGMSIDITSPAPSDPNFLPSEAKRVNTPPMYPGTPEIQARGFFFDLNPRRSDSASPASTTSIAAAKSRSNGHSPSREWWEVDPKHAKTGSKSARPLNMDAAMRQSPQIEFELSIPEHLPSSPLCPKNPMHQSGGTGTCPFHGRKTSNQYKSTKRLELGETSDMPSRGASTRNFIG
ncbi:hypothetical protein VTL71DRAFT_7092 [Oculimacula yallundae]|uniref:Uncharacterized protein n=1 Tax=Oculimacula yallundae TaxID=86028 RepID=A0ABR4BXD5_9HELO